MGGAVLCEVAHRKLFKNVIGLVVIDVVEGTLNQREQCSRRSPCSFKSRNSPGVATVHDGVHPVPPAAIHITQRSDTMEHCITPDSECRIGRDFGSGSAGVGSGEAGLGMADQSDGVTNVLERMVSRNVEQVFVCWSWKSADFGR